MVIELQRLNQIWAFIGGKQLPSVVYRIGMVVLQDEAEAMVNPGEYNHQGPLVTKDL